LVGICVPTKLLRAEEGNHWLPIASWGVIKGRWGFQNVSLEEFGHMLQKMGMEAHLFGVTPHEPASTLPTAILIWF